MKILKKGTIPQPKIRIFRGTCPNCGCEIECTEHEAQVTAERRMNGSQLWTIACPFKLLSYACGSIIPLQEVVTREESLAEAADSLTHNIFAQAEKKLGRARILQIQETARRSAENLVRALKGPHGEDCTCAPKGAIPPQYPVNFGKEVPVEQKSDMAKAFEDFFKPTPGEKGWWEKDYPAPKKTPRDNRNELSKLADDL